MAEVVVEMDLCAKVPGRREYKCVSKGFKATYRKGTVGPTSVSISYPT